MFAQTHQNMGEVLVGIDLGTTTSCVSIYRNTEIEIVPDEYGNDLVPSIVTFIENGILIGTEAEQCAHMYRHNTIYDVKRLIGQNYLNLEVQNFIEDISYNVIDDNGLPKIEIRLLDETKTYLPEEISAFFIKKLKSRVEDFVGFKIEETVVSVPAYFSTSQRRDTEKAAKMAGFKKVNILNAPTAAATAFNAKNPNPNSRNLLVYDFSSSVCEVSIVSITQKSCIIKATLAEKHLGGNDIDKNLVNFIKENFFQKFGVNINGKTEIRRLRAVCQKAKCALSNTALPVSINLCNLSGKDYETHLSLSKFELLNNDILRKTLGTVKKCLDMAQLKNNDINQILLIGGSSKIPKVQEMLIDFFGANKICKNLNPDKCVAYGAVLNLMNNKDLNTLVPLQIVVTEYYNDIQNPRHAIRKWVIPINTSIPLNKVYKYATVYSTTSEITITITKKEQDIVLGQLVFLLKDSGKNKEINVEVHILKLGLIQIKASESEHLNFADIKVDIKDEGVIGKLSNSVTTLFHNRQEEFLCIKHELEHFCFHAQSMLKPLPNGKKDHITDKCNAILKWLKEATIDDIAVMKEKLDNLYLFIAMN